MPPFRLSVGLTLVFLGAQGCAHGDSRSAAGHGGVNSPGDQVTASGATSWFPGSAPLIIAPGRSPDRSLLALADTNEEEPEGVLLDSIGTFVRLDGSRSIGRIAITQSAEGCVEASIDPAPPAPWGVGFIGRPPIALAADSVSSLTRHDSLALTIVAHRLASTIPNDSSGRFSGLPFSVVGLWRIRLKDGGVALVATLKRQINQEDSPLQERTFLVAESDSTAEGGFSMRFSERASGPEESVESRELLGVVQFPPSTAIDLVLAHDFGDAASYSIVERDQRGRWAQRWTSRRFSC
jgi:hypothetical protein